MALSNAPRHRVRLLAAEPRALDNDELDAKARELLADLPSLEELFAQRLPLAFLADLVGPYGPDSERLADEER